MLQNPSETNSTPGKKFQWVDDRKFIEMKINHKQEKRRNLTVVTQMKAGWDWGSVEDF